MTAVVIPASSYVAKDIEASTHPRRGMDTAQGMSLVKEVVVDPEKQSTAGQHPG